MAPRVGPAPFALPLAVQRLPLDLLRTHLITHDPARVADAVVRFQAAMRGAPQPVVLPQTVLYQAWKRAPGLVNTGPYQDPLRTAEGVIAALAYVGRGPNDSIYSYPHFVDPMRARVEALEANRLPVVSAPSGPIAPAITQMRPLDQPLAPPAAAFRQNVVETAATALKARGVAVAMSSAAVARQRALAPLFARRW